MKKNAIALLSLFFTLFCVNNSFSQVVQKKADKWQLINGIKLGPGIKKQNSIKIQTNTLPSFINSRYPNNISKKKHKVVKPPKALKYSNQKSLNTIRKKDEE